MSRFDFIFGCGCVFADSVRRELLADETRHCPICGAHIADPEHDIVEINGKNIDAGNSDRKSRPSFLHRGSHIVPNLESKVAKRMKAIRDTSSLSAIYSYRE